MRNNAKELALLSLYMQRTQRAYERYRNDLKPMQEERKARHAQELEQARMLYQLAEAEGQDYDPQQDGFVFSLPELKAAMDLFHRKLIPARKRLDERLKCRFRATSVRLGRAVPRNRGGRPRPPADTPPDRGTPARPLVCQVSGASPCAYPLVE